MTHLLMLALLGTFLGACQSKPNKSNMNPSKITTDMIKIEKEKIENILDNYKQSLSTANARNAQRLFAKDGVFMPAGAPIAVGAENILNAYNHIFSQIKIDIDFYIDEIVIEENMAYLSSSSKGTATILATGQSIPEENRELFVLEKIDGNWKIVRYMFNKSS